MVYNQDLAKKVSETLLTRGEFVEKKMFGGVAFLYNGNMTVGVTRDDLIVRVGLQNYEYALSKPGTDLFSPTGKPMAGWITVAPTGYKKPADMQKWIDLSLEFVKTLPAK